MQGESWCNRSRCGMHVQRVCGETMEPWIMSDAVCRSGCICVSVVPMNSALSSIYTTTSAGACYRMRCLFLW